MKTLLILALLAVTVRAGDALPYWMKPQNDFERQQAANWLANVQRRAAAREQKDRDAVQRQIALLLQIQVLQAAQQQAQIPRR